jgi:predicted AlkP superfamily pyrophosphatase or phosphodiesterase
MRKKRFFILIIIFFIVMVYVFSSQYIKDIAAVAIGRTEASITDISSRVLQYTAAGKKVMVIYIDGLGYDNYVRLSGEGIMPFISACGSLEKAVTVYPPITDVAFTSMTTGVTPLKHGIRKRGDTGLKAETVFESLANQGKSYRLVEADIKILKADIKTTLNIDENRNGTIDDEIFQSALEAASEGPDLLMVHFHSFDDTGHRFGPYSAEARACAGLLDGYVGKLREQWKGEIIITADHGMHEEGEGGSHGDYKPEDMYIPVIDSAAYEGRASK